MNMSGYVEIEFFVAQRWNIRADVSGGEKEGDCRQLQCQGHLCPENLYGIKTHNGCFILFVNLYGFDGILILFFSFVNLQRVAFLPRFSTLCCIKANLGRMFSPNQANCSQGAKKQDSFMFGVENQVFPEAAAYPAPRYPRLFPMSKPATDFYFHIIAFQPSMLRMQSKSSGFSFLTSFLYCGRSKSLPLYLSIQICLSPTPAS